MTVRADLINSGELIETSDGVRQTIVYLVEGVTGQEHDRRWNALKANGLPRQGEPHKIIPGIRVVERRVSPVTDSPSKFEVAVTWAPPSEQDLQGAPQFLSTSDGAGGNNGIRGPTTWTGRPGTATVKTTVDANGSPMLINYRGQPSISVLNLSQYTAVTQAWANYFAARALASAEKSITTISFTGSRWERDTPEAVAIAFGGFVNSSRFRAFPERTVLSTGIGWAPAHGGGYRVDYNFTYSPEGWDYTEVIKIEGRIPVDLQPDNGKRTFRLYGIDDFRKYEL